MEIAVPEGCTLVSVTVQAESREVFDRLAEQTDPKPLLIGGKDSVQSEFPGDRKYVQEWLMVKPDDDGPTLHVNAPRRYVTVTVEPA